MSGMDGPPLRLGIESFFRLILGFLLHHKNNENKDFNSLNQLDRNCMGRANIMNDNLGRILIFSISALPHRDNGKKDHVFKSYLTLLNKPRAFNSYILEIGAMILMPKYLIPLGFHKKVHSPSPGEKCYN